MQHGQVQYQIAWPRPGRALLGIIIANVVAYVVQLVLLRANVQAVEQLYLRPRDVLSEGYVWQLFTYAWLHNPIGPSDLLFNMLWLWLFGTRLESRWGQRRFIQGYFLLAFGGGVFVVLIGLLSLNSAFAPLLGGFWVIAHLGSSGATTGILAAWGLTYAEEEFNFFLLGRMKGKTLVLIVLGITLLTALSFSGTSTPPLFGGILTAVILVNGLWRPSRWKEMFRRQRLKAKRRQIEHQLRVLEGGGRASEPKSKEDDPSKWN